MMPPTFNPWAALLELGADLLLTDGRRWACVHQGKSYASARTNGGLGILWADVEGREAVWLAWEAARGGEDYPQTQTPPVWSERAKLRASVRGPRTGSAWRVFTWAFGSSGLREPGEVLDGDDPEALVWELLARGDAKGAA